MSLREFTRARFFSDMLGNVYFDGYTDGDSWNGWACPYFTQETAEAILNTSKENGYTWSYDETAACFIVRHNEDPEDYEPERFAGVKILAENREIIVFAIGAYSWAWNIG